MIRHALLLVSLLGTVTADGGAVVFESKPARTHLLELFTSEGCSSCLPAEAWLSNLKNEPRLVFQIAQPCLRGQATAATFRGEELEEMGAGRFAFENDGAAVCGHGPEKGHEKQSVPDHTERLRRD